MFAQAFSPANLAYSEPLKKRTHTLVSIRITAFYEVRSTSAASRRPPRDGIELHLSIEIYEENAEEIEKVLKENNLQIKNSGRGPSQACLDS